MKVAGVLAVFIIGSASVGASSSVNNNSSGKANDQANDHDQLRGSHNGRLRNLQTTAKASKAKAAKASKSKSSKGMTTTTSTTTSTSTTGATTTTGSTSTTTSTTTASTTIGTSTTVSATTLTTTATTTIAGSICGGEIVSVDTCVDADHSCFQNNNYGEQEPAYHIDINIEVEDPDTVCLYNDARTRWMDVIIGDLPSRESMDSPTFAPSPTLTPCSNDLPPTIDDVYICVRDDEIDGTGGMDGNVLAFAGPLWVRDEGSAGTVTTITGRARFDIVDVPSMKNNNFGGVNRLTQVATHEMGHVLGLVSGIWTAANNLVNTTLNSNGKFDYQGAKGLEVWNDDWGCDGSPQVQNIDGIPRGHWDEECFLNEMMTPIIDFGLNPLSNLTIAVYEDSGYTVNFNAADAYDGSNSPCCDGDISNIVPIDTPTLSDAARASAVAIGKQILKDSQRPANPAEDIMAEELGLRYVGDKIIYLMVEEKGHLFDVDVSSDESDGELV